jgi:hypothetical protein
MTTEQVPTWRLEAGDVIRIRHHHDAQCGQCLSHWQTEAVVTEAPVPVAGRLAINWAATSGVPAARAAVTGVSVFGPDEQIVRVGRLPAGWPLGLAPPGLHRCQVIRHQRWCRAAERPSRGHPPGGADPGCGASAASRLG